MEAKAGWAVCRQQSNIVHLPIKQRKHPTLEKVKKTNWNQIFFFNIAVPWDSLMPTHITEMQV